MMEKIYALYRDLISTGYSEESACFISQEYFRRNCHPMRHWDSLTKKICRKYAHITEARAMFLSGRF